MDSIERRSESDGELLNTAQSMRNEVGLAERVVFDVRMEMFVSIDVVVRVVMEHCSWPQRVLIRPKNFAGTQYNGANPFGMEFRQTRAFFLDDACSTWYDWVCYYELDQESTSEASRAGPHHS